MRIHEDRTDPATGQDVALSTNPALAEFWTTAEPVRDYAHMALLKAQDAVREDEHPEAYRHVIGLREGWEAALAARREGATPDQQSDDAEPEHDPA